MKSFLVPTAFFLWLTYTKSVNSQGAARRTAPRRTTLPGGTYGTETYATVTQASTLSTAALIDVPAVTAPPVPVWNPLNAQPSFAAVPAIPVPSAVAGLVSAGGVAMSATRRRLPNGQTVPFRAMPTMPPQEEDGQDTPGETANAQHVPVVSLCEEVEEGLKVGSVEQECWIGDPVILRYWQPYRALRNIRCKNGNTTAPGDTPKDQCPLAYPGATCVQKYQQFVVLAAMGPASSGWSCIRLASGCSCSVRAFKRLRSTDYEQRSDLREFMKS